MVAIYFHPTEPLIQSLSRLRTLGKEVRESLRSLLFWLEQFVVVKEAADKVIRNYPDW